MRRASFVSFSFGSRIFFTLLSAILISSVVNLIFLNEIANFKSSDQSQFIIDGYFYLHLGQEALLIAARENISLYAAADSIRLNSSSSGIVFLSSLTSAVVPWIWLIPTLFACIYAVLIIALSRSYRIARNFYLLFLTGLLPYLYIPTKETFFLIGLMLTLICIRRSGWVVLLPVSFSIMYLARPEAFFILIASYAIYFLVRRLSLMMLTFMIALAGCIYWFMLREIIYVTSSLFELASESAETGFCNVGPLFVCIGDGESSEFIYLQRLLSVLGLPLKWILDIFQLMTDDTLNPSAWILRLAQGIQVVAIGIGLRQHIRTRRPLDTTQVSLLVFAGLYLTIYSTVLYYQVSRQALLATHIVLLALLLSESPLAPKRKYRFLFSHRLG